ASLPPPTVSALLATVLLSLRAAVALLALAHAGDRRDDVLLGGCFGVEAARSLSQPEDEDPVSNLEDVNEVVADHDNPEAALAQAADQVQHLRRLGDPEGRSRLGQE